MVSIIIPVYNGEKTLRRCLDSVISQTLIDKEIIVINDGSTDSTGQILEEYKNKYSEISVITKENAGQGKARNDGIKLSHGEFVGFVDSDDYIEPQMFEEMLSKIADADVCQCNIRDIYEDGHEKIQLNFEDGTIEVGDKSKYIEEYLFPLKHSFESCNKLFRKSFLINNNIEFGNNKEIYSEDFFLNIQVIKALNKIVFVNKPYYHYYQISTSHSKTAKIEDAALACNIFERSIEPEIEVALSKLAVLFILTLASSEWKKARVILKRKDVKKYIRCTIKNDTRPHYRLTLFVMLYAPTFISKCLMKLYYGQILAQIKERIKGFLGRK